MGISSVPQAGKFGYLSPCTHCGADNGITATLCWRCDTALESSGPSAVDQLLGRERPAAPPAAPPTDLHDQSAAAHHARHSAEGEPSFFPVLREEVTGTPDAANDEPPGAGDDTPPHRKSRTPRNASVMASLLAAGALIAVIAFAPDWLDGLQAPLPRAPIDGAATVSTLRAAYVAPTAQAATPPVAVPPAAEAPAAASSCTPAVVALGLCTAAAN
jgi:hypothetical protein